jgi:hypothetical protein
MDTVEYTLQGNVAYTSINDVARQGDLISRQLQFSLNIRTQNTSELAFWDDREKEKPAILDYIFSTLAKAIPIYKNELTANKHGINHRLADTILLYEAISQAMGEEKGRILRIFNSVEKEQQERVMTNSTFNEFFREFCFSYLVSAAEKDLARPDIYHIEVSAKVLLQWMKDYAAKEEAALVDHYGNWKDDDFPKNGRSVGRKIGRLRKQLANIGILIPEPEHTNKGARYRITIERPQAGQSPS